MLSTVTVYHLLFMIKWIRQRLDWGLLLALVMALVAAAPFLTRPGLPRETDTELHVYRAAELGHMLRAGVFYPRWASDLYFGYGYPIFNYYAPFTYYLANLFDLLPGVDIVGGVKAVFVLGFVVASLGAYLLGCELFGSLAGRGAGVLAAASFTFSPYVAFIDPYARGVLAEHFAICLLPLAFYAFRRLMSGTGGWMALMGGVFTLAAIMLSHNLLVLVAAVLLLVYWMWEVVFGIGRSRAGWGVLTLVLAATITTFFWLPFLLERDAIKLEVIGPGHFDFHEHFLSLAELLAPSRIFDLGATAPHYRFNLGLAQWLFALPAIGAFFYLKARKNSNETLTSRSHISLLYFILVGGVLIFLMMSVSTPIWEQVPGVPYLQFPWRLMGPANLMLAIAAAGSVVLLAALSAPRWRDPILAVAIGAILLLALPILYPPTWSPDFGGTLPQDIIEWERKSLAIGTTSTGDFLPVEAARVRMRPMPTLVESYTQPGPVDRVNRVVLPKGAELEIVDHGPLHDRFAISTPKKFVLRLYTFYFPGWRAYVDGEQVEIDVAGPEGFITLQVPQGEHDVLVRFEDTPPRTAGWIISSAGLIVLIIASFLIRSLTTRDLCLPRLTSRSVLWLAGTLVLFIFLKSIVIDSRDEWLRYTSPPGQAWAAQHEQRLNFGGQIELLGYDLPRARVRSGETFPLVLYWHALTSLDTNYQSFVHMARPLHILWGQEDHLNPAGLPTKRWPLDKYVWDKYEIQVLPGTPPGEYALNVGIYSRAGGYRLEQYNVDGQVVGDSAMVSSIQVERPHRQPRISELGMTSEVMTTFSEGGVTLLGYAQSRQQASVKDAWPITLFWRADRDQPAARVRDLVLLDTDGQEVDRISGIPLDGYYPFDNWQTGEVVRDPLWFTFVQPVRLDAGIYHFGAIVSGDDGPLNPDGALDEFVLLGTVELVEEEKE
ncbi:MAG: hypothetical protein GY832_09990 [Chloroflexi bacterium]|nr:hypothetical protein [Chloroflexota bacterium]